MPCLFWCGVLITPEEVAAAALELIQGERTGVVRELIGGASRTVDEGTPMTPQAR
jgi:hypothetical protein